MQKFVKLKGETNMFSITCTVKNIFSRFVITTFFLLSNQLK